MLSPSNGLSGAKQRNNVRSSKIEKGRRSPKLSAIAKIENSVFAKTKQG
jgi:hypothetical protein